MTILIMSATRKASEVLATTKFCKVQHNKERDGENGYSPIEDNGCYCATGVLAKEIGLEPKGRRLYNKDGSLVETGFDQVEQAFNLGDTLSEIFRLNDKYKTFKPIIKYLREHNL